MSLDNLAVVFTVIAVVTFVLAIALAGTYCLNKDIDQNANS